MLHLRQSKEIREGGGACRQLARKAENTNGERRRAGRAIPFSQGRTTARNRPTYRNAKCSSPHRSPRQTRAASASTTSNERKTTHVYQSDGCVREVVDPRHARAERHERQKQTVPPIARHPPLVGRQPHRHPRRQPPQKRHPAARQNPNDAGAPQAERPHYKGRC